MVRVGWWGVGRCWVGTGKAKKIYVDFFIRWGQRAGRAVKVLMLNVVAPTHASRKRQAGRQDKAGSKHGCGYCRIQPPSAPPAPSTPPTRVCNVAFRVPEGPHN